MIELAKKIKKDEHKLELLPSTDFDIAPHVEDIEDDPRVGMSKEEMIFYEQQEQQDLERRMDRFMQGAGSAQPNTSGISDDEEEEIFTLNLEEGRIEQKIVDVVMPVEQFKEAIKEIAAPVNPYADLITNIFTKKALQSLLRKLSASKDLLDTVLARSVTPVQVDTIAKAVNELHDQIVELRSSFSGFSRDVYYDKIPTWADKHVKIFIEDHLDKLIEFVDEE